MKWIGRKSDEDSQFDETANTGNFEETQRTGNLQSGFDSGSFNSDEMTPVS
jgi:hypothetical protein